MRQIFWTLGLIGLVGCNQSPFGESFDECVLRNVNAVGGEVGQTTASDICQRHFERAPTQADLKKISSDIAIRYDQPGLIDISKQEDRMAATLWNESDSIVLTKVTITVDFYSSPPDREGHWTKGAWLDRAVWDRDVMIYPAKSDDIVGVFGDEERAPSRYYKGQLTVRRVLPVGPQ